MVLLVRDQRVMRNWKSVVVRMCLLSGAQRHATRPAEPSSILHVHCGCSMDHTYKISSIHMGLLSQHCFIYSTSPALPSLSLYLYMHTPCPLPRQLCPLSIYTYHVLSFCYLRYHPNCSTYTKCLRTSTPPTELLREKNQTLLSALNRRKH